MIDSDLLFGLYAYETGCTDTGIHDPGRKCALFKELNAMDDDEFRITIGRLVRDETLSENALKLGYGLEDVVEFAEWLFEQRGEGESDE